MKISHIALATAGLLAFSAPAWVHHSGAMFDPGREQTIVGTVTEFNWTNPHSSFKVEVTDAAGKSEVWAVEMNGPQNLMHDGWKRSSIKPGDKISAVVHFIHVLLASPTISQTTMRMPCESCAISWRLFPKMPHQCGMCRKFANLSTRPMIFPASFRQIRARPMTYAKSLRASLTAASSRNSRPSTAQQL